MNNTKTDNGNMEAKLELRRYFLSRYHPDGGSVLDCCQGGGLIWRALREEFPALDYWGVDLKPKPGRLRVDSTRILQLPGIKQNIVDIDTYGMPWDHYFGLARNLDKPTTVFLTIGMVRMGGGGNIGKAALSVMGINFFARKIPPSIQGRLSSVSVPYCLTYVAQYGIIIVEAVEAVSAGNARYIGVRLEPKQ